MAKKNLIVGLFVLAALALFSIGLFLIGNRNEAFSRHMDFYAEFKNLSGLTKGSKVQVAGMNAGQVMEIGIPASPSSPFRVRMRIDEKLHGLVRTDSVAAINTEGIVGDTFLQISPGSSQADLALPQATLHSKELTDIAALLEQAKGALADIDSTVKNADGQLTSVGGDLSATLVRAKTTLTNVNDVAVGVKQGRGSVGMLLRDQAVAGQIREAIGNAQHATYDLNHASSQADDLLSDINARNFPGKINDTLATVKDTASNFDASSQQIRQVVADFAGSDQQGVTAGVNLRESLSNANAATANIADNTEALKHNFFFKSFFRHRGYYSLAHINPDKYRHDRLFANPANSRIWLRADQLFVKGPDEIDQLTAEGKAILNRTLAENGATIVETPIVVEGYSDESILAGRIAVSRHRSILVRTYLLNHFQLEPGNLGSVAMEDRATSGLDHTQWNGIAIVLLKPKP